MNRELILSRLRFINLVTKWNWGDEKMNFTDEKDYIMRMIKEMVRVVLIIRTKKR